MVCFNRSRYVIAQKVSDDMTTQKFDLEDGFYPPFSISTHESQAYQSSI